MSPPPTLSGRISVTPAQLSTFADLIGLTDAAPGRCSVLLTFELYCRTIFPIPGDPVKVAAEVRSLEGLGPVGTKKEEQFRRTPLKGLWKKHYIVGDLRSMGRNIQNEFGHDNKNLLQIIERNYIPGASVETVAKRVSAEIIALYTLRASKKRLTGEWLVFAKHDLRNYYLSLASHDEDDDEIYDRIRSGCLCQYPFLRSQLSL